MAGKRVHQLAKELGISSKELLEVLQSMGEDIQNPLSSISEKVEKDVAKKLAKPKAEKPKKKAEEFTSAGSSSRRRRPRG
jgi:translation initiation factor IF-2